MDAPELDGWRHTTELADWLGVSGSARLAPEGKESAA
jgi:hypothetical protein